LNLGFILYFKVYQNWYFTTGEDKYEERTNKQKERKIMLKQTKSKQVIISRRIKNKKRKKTKGITEQQEEGKENCKI
jgi:hypothetical protein